MAFIHHILVPSDFGEPARYALDYAVELAKQLDARLTLMHAYDVPVYAYAELTDLSNEVAKTLESGARARLEEAARALRQQLPGADALLKRGKPWQAIQDVVAESGADLVVMGTHGRRGVQHALLGSVAERTARLSSVPVLIVHGRASAPAG